MPMAIALRPLRVEWDNRDDNFHCLGEKGLKIVVFNGKGGVGKSTIAANLAVISGASLLDADPQATCCYWGDRRWIFDYLSPYL